MIHELRIEGRCQRKTAGTREGTPGRALENREGRVGLEGDGEDDSEEVSDDLCDLRYGEGINRKGRLRSQMETCWQKKGV